jgi:hypothetical protein
MNNESPYSSPESDLSIKSSNDDISGYRKALVPKWIRVFGWVFIVFGCYILLLGIYCAVSGIEGEFFLYGIEATGSVFTVHAMVVIGLYLAHGVCAYGLLFAKAWGVRACIVLAYLSICICIYTMFTDEGLSLRLELAILCPYIVKLHRLMPVWYPNENI